VTGREHPPSRTRTQFEKERQAWREHVLDLPDMSGRAALLVWVLAHWFNFAHWKETGDLLAYPSFDRLQKDMAAGSRTTVSKATGDLERLGAVRIVRSESRKVPGVGPRRERNQYVGQWPAVVHTGVPRQRTATVVHFRGSHGCTEPLNLDLPFLTKGRRPAVDGTPTMKKGATERSKKEEQAAPSWSTPILTELVDTETLWAINDYLSEYGPPTFAGLAGRFSRADVQTLLSAGWLVRDDRGRLRRHHDGRVEDAH